MGMGLLTSAISKAEDKHRTGRKREAGGQADGQGGIRQGKDPYKDPYDATVAT